MKLLAPRPEPADGLRLPSPQSFAAHPASWHLFCRSRDLRRGPQSRTVLGRRLVAFRGGSGEVSVLDAHCAHLNADLGRGTVVGDTLRCPFHQWQYGGDGRCTRIPSLDTIPDFARQRTYPVHERHGYVFFFHGRQALFPLPFFEGEDPDAFAASRVFRFVADCPWYMLCSNGFDGQHFASVHDRRLIGPPRVELPAPHSRRVRFQAEVIGRSFTDRILSRFAGDKVDVTITNWGGTLVLVTGAFRRACSYLMVVAQPAGEHATLVEVMALAPRWRSGAAQTVLGTLGLEVRRFFTGAFMNNDIRYLSDIRYQPDRLTAADDLLMDFFRWAAARPDGDGECTAS